MNQVEGSYPDNPGKSRLSGQPGLKKVVQKTRVGRGCPGDPVGRGCPKNPG